MRLALGIERFEADGPVVAYTHLLAVQLQRLGHDVRIVTAHPGAAAAHAVRAGIRVAAPGDGDVPDAILAQDLAGAATVAACWPDVPQVGVVHTVGAADPAAPARLVRADDDHVARPQLVVVLDDRADPARDAAVPVLRECRPVDVDRFRRRGPIAAAPRRVLLLEPDPAGALAAVVAAAGGTVVTATADPVEERIARADVVVGRGADALAAMASARAVHVPGAGWVTPDRYAALESAGFAGGTLDPAGFARDLPGYDHQMGDDNRGLVIARHLAGGHAARLARACAALPIAQPAGPTRVEQTELLTRARTHSRWRLEQIEAQAAAAEARVAAARSRVEDAAARAAAATSAAHALQSTRRYRLTATAVRPLDRLRSALHGDRRARSAPRR